MDSITIQGFIFRVISHGDIIPENTVRVISHGDIIPENTEKERHVSVGILPNFPPAGETYEIEKHEGWKALDVEIETEEPSDEVIKELGDRGCVDVYFEHDGYKFGNQAILILKSVDSERAIIDLLGI